MCGDCNDSVIHATKGRSGGVGGSGGGGGSDGDACGGDGGGDREGHGHTHTHFSIENDCMTWLAGFAQTARDHEH